MTRMGEVTWEIRERSSLDDVLSVQRLQNLGAPEPLEATLHIVIIKLKGLCSENPAEEEERKKERSQKGQMAEETGSNMVSL